MSVGETFVFVVACVKGTVVTARIGSLIAGPDVVLFDAFGAVLVPALTMVLNNRSKTAIEISILR